MAKEMDRHLSSFIILYNQYHKHHWLVEGPQFRDLHLFLKTTTIRYTSSKGLVRI